LGADHRTGSRRRSGRTSDIGDYWWLILIVVVAALALWYFLRRNRSGV
jgi:LPXTG-motif cell wall-anchored protein